MSNDQYYPQQPRTIIPVTVYPNDDQRFIRFRSPNTLSDGIHDRMSARMREFEEECRRWREKFFNESRLESSGFPSSSLIQPRPRMHMDFPDFPEFGSIDWPTFRGPSLGFGPSSSGAAQRSFIEEDNDGRKRYKIQFEVGDFRPEELNVKVEGRMLLVKGDRQIKAGTTTESKQFNRELTLPDFIDIQTLQSYLSDDGVLTMEAPVILDRFYNSSGSSALTSSSPNRLHDSSFMTGRQPLSNYNYGNTQSNTYSSTSSASSFRQEGPSYRETSSFTRNSPLRDPYSSTSSASTLIGGGNNNINQSPTTYTTRQNYSTNDRIDGRKNVTYTFDLQQFAPEDIAIQVNDTMLKVTAVKQERDGRGSTHREFRREIGLPDGADPKNLTNILSNDGTLTINIPVRDYRPPLTPTYQSERTRFPTNTDIKAGEQQLKLTFDLAGYKPEDVSVKVNDNVLKVQASHVESSGSSQINREYMREYVLPEWVDVDNLRAKMSEDSTLTVEAPIPNDRIPALNRQIKITQ